MRYTHIRKKWEYKMNKKIKKILCGIFASEDAQSDTEYTILIGGLLYVILAIQLLKAHFMLKLGEATKNMADISHP